MFVDNSLLGAQHVAALRAQTQRSAERRAVLGGGFLHRVRRVRAAR